MGGDKHGLTESPSTPAFSRIPLPAPGLSKALELMQDKGKDIKKRKCTGAEEPLRVTLPAWGSWPLYSFIPLYNLFIISSQLCCLCQGAPGGAG